MVKKKNAEPIGGILASVLERLRSEAAAGILDVCRVWPEAVGEEAAHHSRPAGIKGPVLLVAVESSPWLHHLHFQKSRLIARVNELLGRRVVEDIKFTIGAT